MTAPTPKTPPMVLGKRLRKQPRQARWTADLGAKRWAEVRFCDSRCEWVGSVWSDDTCALWAEWYGANVTVGYIATELDRFLRGLGLRPSRKDRR